MCVISEPGNLQLQILLCSHMPSATSWTASSPPSSSLGWRGCLCAHGTCHLGSFLPVWVLLCMVPGNKAALLKAPKAAENSGGCAHYPS